VPTVYHRAKPLERLVDDPLVDESTGRPVSTEHVADSLMIGTSHRPSATSIARDAIAAATTADPTPAAATALYHGLDTRRLCDTFGNRTNSPSD
jgi:hypothetical protein